MVICYSGGEIVGDKILEVLFWLGKDGIRVCIGDDEGFCGDWDRSSGLRVYVNLVVYMLWIFI